MIKLSYSTLNLLINHPHCWLNKQMGIPPEEKPEWAIGKKIHRIIQDHVSGRKKVETLKHIDFTFPIVEERDFDERCRFGFNYGAYYITGFYDGLDLKNKRFLEIKSTDPIWSISRFKNSFQRMLYALSGDFEEAVLITGSKNMENWKTSPPKVYVVPITDEDRERAREWIEKGIGVLEGGNFLSDLTKMPDGTLKCTDKWCYWGCNCHWK